MSWIIVKKKLKNKWAKSWTVDPSQSNGYNNKSHHITVGEGTGDQDSEQRESVNRETEDSVSSH